MAANCDLVFTQPVFVPKIWGGRRLEADFGYDIPDGLIGECWAISAHPNGDCPIVGGPFEGMTLSQLYATRRDLFGGIADEVFPLLVKVLDARENLSVQVHPDDAYAAEHENGSLGKQECWYVLAADEGAHIVVGQHAADREQFADLVAHHQWHELLNEIPVHAGDFFSVLPGTIHAILEGTLILETQQSSDVTYRVYDFDRIGDDGKPRELHLQQSMDVVDYDQIPPRDGAITAPEVDGVTHLLSCEKFDVFRVRVSEGAPVTVEQPWPFLCVSATAGTTGSVTVGEKTYELRKGSHFIAPAGCGALTFSGDLELVCSHV